MSSTVTAVFFLPHRFNNYLIHLVSPLEITKPTFVHVISVKKDKRNLDNLPATQYLPVFYPA